MPSVHDALYWANRRAVAREITRRGYRVSGETLNRWVREKSEVPAVVEHIVFDLFGIREDRNAPPPETWVTALADEIEGRMRMVLSGTGSDQPGLAQEIADDLAGSLGLAQSPGGADIRADTSTPQGAARKAKRRQP